MSKTRQRELQQAVYRKKAARAAPEKVPGAQHLGAQHPSAPDEGEDDDDSELRSQGREAFLDGMSRPTAEAVEEARVAAYEARQRNAEGITVEDAEKLERILRESEGDDDAALRKTLTDPKLSAEQRAAPKARKRVVYDALPWDEVLGQAEKNKYVLLAEGEDDDQLRTAVAIVFKHVPPSQWGADSTGRLISNVYKEIKK